MSQLGNRIRVLAIGILCYTAMTTNLSAANINAVEARSSAQSRQASNPNMPNLPAQNNDMAAQEILEIGFDAYFGLAADTPRKLASLYDRYPLNTTVRHLVGRQLLREKNITGAILLLAIAAEQETQNELLQTDTGRAFEGAGKSREALRYYERARSLSPYSAFRYNDCARMLEAMGNQDDALAYYKKSLLLFSNQPEIKKKMQLFNFQ